MQDIPFPSAVRAMREAIDALIEDPMAYDHIYLSLNDGRMVIEAAHWGDDEGLVSRKTTQTYDDRANAITEFECELNNDTNKFVWLEIYPSSIEHGYSDVAGTTVSVTTEYTTESESGERPESLTECA